MTRSRLQEWEDRSEWPLAVAALLFLASYSWLVLDPSLDRAWRHALGTVDYATWAVFVVDYGVRLSLAKPRASWFIRHLLDLLVVALPVLRPLRLLRLVVLIRVLNRRAAHSLQGRVAVYLVASTTLVLYGGALAELSAERGARGASIQSFGTALWWAVSTITTVGYGDVYPVTTEGRLIAAAVMFAGIGVVGTVTASIAGYLVSTVGSTRQSDADVLARLDAVQTQLTELAARLDPGGAAASDQSSST